MPRIKNEKYITVMSTVVGVVVFVYGFIRALALGLKKTGNRLQPVADWIFLSVPGTGFAFLVFAVLTAKCFDQAIAINQSATTWEAVMWASLACTCVSLAAFLFALVRLSRLAELKLKEA